MNSPQVSFQGFLKVFPEVELPVTLNEESVSVFGRNNDPLPVPMIEQFIAAGEPEQDDDGMTEYVPCLRIPETHDFHAIVYWKGGLMKSEFVMTTYTKDGAVLNSAVIGGMELEGNSILRSIATIDENWIIHIVEGQHDATSRHYSPGKTSAYQMELLATGEIIYLVMDSDDDDM